MTDPQLTTAFMQVSAIEQRARGCVESRDEIERQTALAVVRLAVPLKRQLETWMTQRACRAAVGAQT